MGNLERRLKTLEAVTGTTQGVQERSVRRAALGRMTDEDLRRLEAAVVRSEAGEEPTPADREIVARSWALKNEVVAREFAQKA